MRQLKIIEQHYHTTIPELAENWATLWWDLNLYCDTYTFKFILIILSK
jgi:hypothetical protein